jgi:hypothetical protein
MGKEHLEKQNIVSEGKSAPEVELMDFAELELERLRRGLEDISNYNMRLDSVIASIGVDKERAEAIRAEMGLDKEIMDLVKKTEDLFQVHKNNLKKLLMASLAFLLLAEGNDEYSQWKEEEKTPAVESALLVKDNSESETKNFVDLSKGMSKDNKQKNERLVDINFQIVKKHIASDAYLDKLIIEYEGDEESARYMQEKRLENLNTVKIFLMDLESVNLASGPIPYWVPERLAKFLADHFDLNGDAMGFYIREDHTAIVSPASEVIIHELLHASTKLDDDISKRADEILDQSFDPSAIDSDRVDYLKINTERLVRKQMVELFLDLKGIKKYGESVDHQDLEQLLELKDQDTSFLQELIDSTDSNNFYLLFDEIAGLGPNKKGADKTA